MLHYGREYNEKWSTGALSSRNKVFRRKIRNCPVEIQLGANEEMVYRESDEAINRR